MATTYILYSKSIDRYYTGSCENFNTRLKQHLNKTFHNSFTSKADDWEVYLLIENLNFNQARSIEKHIKAMKSRKYIQNLKKYPEMTAKFIKRFYIE
jgi:putative endonuclease